MRQSIAINHSFNIIARDVLPRSPPFLLLSDVETVNGRLYRTEDVSVITTNQLDHFLMSYSYVCSYYDIQCVKYISFRPSGYCSSVYISYSLGFHRPQWLAIISRRVCYECRLISRVFFYFSFTLIRFGPPTTRVCNCYHPLGL